MKEKIPESYFKTIGKVSIILDKSGKKNMKGLEIAQKLNVSNNYIFPVLRTLRLLGLIDRYGTGLYSLSENGKFFTEYLEDNKQDSLKKLGESIIFDYSNNNTAVLRSAHNKIKNHPKINDYELGMSIAQENNKKWKTKSSYEKLGGFCKSILKGFYLLESKKTKHDLKQFMKQEDNFEILGNLNRYCNQFISIVAQDKNAWKNYIELRKKIEESYDKLIDSQNEFIVKDYLKTSKKWLKEGFNTKNIEYLRESINIIAKLDYNKIIK